MRFFLIILLLIFASCSMGKKQVYMCGDRECADKKEIDEYFEKNLSLEVSTFEEKEKKSLDLVKLNLNPANYNKKIKSKNLSQKKISKIKEKQKKDELRQELKEKRRLAKLKAKEEKKLIKLKKKENKKHISKKNKKTKFKKKKKRSMKVEKTKINKLCPVLEKCDIDEISNYLIKIGEEKGYPDITKE